MSTTVVNRPETPMGRALAGRALALAAALPEAPRSQTNLIDLTTPEPPVAAAHVREAAKAALDRGETHYTSRPGVPELRAALARRSSAEGFPATADTVVVTNGGAEALYIALQRTLAPGDRILVGAPVRPNVVETIRFVGAEPVLLPTEAASRFVPPLETISAAEATALLLASPSPVTGVAIPPDDLIALVGVAVERGMAVILDRSLASAVYDPSWASFGDPGLGAKVLTVGSLSVGHGLNGWRVGWFAAPEDRIKGLRDLKQAMSICTTAVSQFAALAALEGPVDWLDERRRSFAIRRDTAIAALTGAGFPVVPPDAYPALLVDVRTLDADDRDSVARLEREAGVRVEPGSSFGAGTVGFIRIDLGTGERALSDGLERIARLGKGRVRS